MLKGIYSTMSGKFVTEKRMEKIANNISNALTAGYKSSRPAINIIKAEGDQGQTVTKDETFISILESYIDFSEAPLVETKNALDLAIDGNGFFVVSTKEGDMYTRNGQFTLDKDKKLTTLDGMPVLGERGIITIDGRMGGDIKIENDGSIYVDKVLVDKLKIVDFKDKRVLKHFGSSRFVKVDPNAQETPPEKFSVKQGCYEASNVDVIKEMVDMVSALRAYESYTRVDQFFNDILTKLINLGRI
ncbi:MAG: flagellar basal-body rod protein FlgF [Syntrophorhabdaceae bacterium]|nr:flagellar basal-body rod protein FlgF [Syntrophorhabdaceae bacterium]